MGTPVLLLACDLWEDSKELGAVGTNVIVDGFGDDFEGIAGRIEVVVAILPTGVGPGIWCPSTG